MQTQKDDNYYQRLVDENRRLNDREYEERATELKSYPKSLFIQLDAPCNQDCLFCSRPDSYNFFDLEKYRRVFEEPLMPAVERAERINMTGSGELLSLPKAKEVLDYFNQFRHAEKMFATNGSSLTPDKVDIIADSKNRYILHVSMHSCTPELHQVMTKAGHYDKVMANLAYLRKVKETNPQITLNLIFVATTRNIESLPDFVNFAADQGADNVVVYYNFVYRLDQKELSCYFKQDVTNEMIELARAVGVKRGIRVHLPQKFKQKEYSGEQICREAWTQFMVNPEGDVITCDAAGDSRESLLGKSFMDVWNGEYYRKIRQFLAGGNQACSNFCLRANPGAINDFKSHFITRGKSPEELAKFMEGV